MTTTSITTTQALNELDFEVPGVPEYDEDMSLGGFDIWLDEALEVFENFNKVSLEGEALRTFKRNAVDIYSTN